MAYIVVGRWHGDHPVVAAVIGTVGGVLPYVTIVGDHWQLVVVGDTAEAAAEAAQQQMLAPIRPRLEAAEAFRREFRELVSAKWRNAEPRVYIQVGVRQVADAIDEGYMVVKRHIDGDAHDWRVIEKIINYCGGDVDHFRKLFIAGGWRAIDVTT